MNRLHAVIFASAFAMLASGVEAGAQAGTQQPTNPRPTTQQPQKQDPTTDRPTTQQPRTQQPTTRDAAATSASDSAAFAQKAAMGGKKEVEMARFAAGKASNPEVKAYAEQLVKDHTAANNELMSLMKSKNVAAAPEAKAEQEDWRNQSGMAFDRAFIDHAISEHQSTIAMFEAQSKNGSDPQVKAWATQKLPTLREHLKTAQNLKSKLGTSTH